MKSDEIGEKNNKKNPQQITEIDSSTLKPIFFIKTLSQYICGYSNLQLITKPKHETKIFKTFSKKHHTFKALQFWNFQLHAKHHQRLKLEGKIRQRITYYQSKKLYEPKSLIFKAEVSMTICSTNENEQSVVVVERPFYHRYSFSDLLQNNSLINLEELDLLKITKNLIDISINAGGYDNAILTTDNLYFQQCKKSFFMDATSFKGEKFESLTKSDSLDVNSFNRIYPYCDSKILARPGSNRLNFQIKVRSVAILLLSLIIGKKVQFQLHKNSSKTISFDEILTSLTSIQSKFQLFLHHEKVLNKISKHKTITGVDYLNFFENILVNEQEYHWMDVIKQLIPCQQGKYEIERKVDEGSLNRYWESMYDSESAEVKSWLAERRLDHIELYVIISCKLDIPNVLNYNSIKHYIQNNQHLSPDADRLFQSFLSYQSKQFNRLNQNYSSKKQLLFTGDERCENKYEFGSKTQMNQSQHFIKIINFFSNSLKTEPVKSMESIKIRDDKAISIQQFMNLGVFIE